MARLPEEHPPRSADEQKECHSHLPKHLRPRRSTRSPLATVVGHASHVSPGRRRCRSRAPVHAVGCCAAAIGLEQRWSSANATEVESTIGRRYPSRHLDPTAPFVAAVAARTKSCPTNLTSLKSGGGAVVSGWEDCAGASDDVARRPCHPRPHENPVVELLATPVVVVASSSAVARLPVRTA